MQAPPNTPQGLTVPYHQTLPTSEESITLPDTHSHHFEISSASSDADTSSEAWMAASEAWTADSPSDDSELDFADFTEDMPGAWEARSEATMMEEASKPEVAVHAAAAIDTNIDLERGQVEGAPAAPDDEVRAKDLLLGVPAVCLAVLFMILLIACLAWLVTHVFFYMWSALDWLEVKVTGSG